MYRWGWVGGVQPIAFTGPLPLKFTPPQQRTRKDPWICFDVPPKRDTQFLWILDRNVTYNWTLWLRFCFIYSSNTTNILSQTLIWWCQMCHIINKIGNIWMLFTQQVWFCRFFIKVHWLFYLGISQWWMNEWMNKRTNEWINEQTNQWSVWRFCFYQCDNWKQTVSEHWRSDWANRKRTTWSFLFCAAQE